MRIVIISASPNEIGLTNSCVEVCKKTLEVMKIETKWICLNNYTINKCEACGERGWGKCLEEHECNIEDDFNELQEEVQEYDAMIIVTPVYFYEMSEAAKTFFDRLKRCQSFHEFSGLRGKELITIACAGGSGDGTDNTLHSMSILAKFLKMNLLDEIGVTKKNYEFQKERIKQSMQKLVKVVTK